MHDERDELRQRGAEALTLVGGDDVLVDALGYDAVLEDGGQRRFVRDQRADVAGEPGDPVEGERSPAAGSEHVDRAQTRGLDDAVHVLTVQLAGDRAVRGQGAALGTARVVGDDGAVGEVGDELLEAGCRHRRAEDEQRPVPARDQRLTHVVRQDGAGRLDGVGADV